MFMKRLAYHILGRSNELQLPITNFQINKLVYFTVVYALKEKLISKDRMEMLYQSSPPIWEPWFPIYSIGNFLNSEPTTS